MMNKKSGRVLVWLILVIVGVWALFNLRPFHNENLADGFKHFSIKNHTDYPLILSIPATYRGGGFSALKLSLNSRSEGTDAELGSEYMYFKAGVPLELSSALWTSGVSIRVPEMHWDTTSPLQSLIGLGVEYQTVYVDLLHTVEADRVPLLLTFKVTSWMRKEKTLSISITEPR